jgi:serine/threonine protein kinase
MGAGGSVIASKCAKNKHKGEKKQYKDYTIGTFIAEGVSGKVHSGKNLATNSDVALKFFGYCENYDAKHEHIWLEIDAMLAVRGIEGLVQIQGYFLDTKKGLLCDKLQPQAYPVIIMELLAGGPLFGRINYRDTISEKFIAHIFRKMICT